MKKNLLILLAFIALNTGAFAQATLPLAWDFVNPSITTPPAGWTMNLGTNGNLTYSFGAGDAISCRLDATGENVVIFFNDKPGTLSYYLSPQNAGAAWGGLFEIQESANGSSWTTVRSIVSKTTTATNFTGGRYADQLQSSSRYVRFNFTTKLPGGQPTPGGNMALDSVMLTTAPPATTPQFQLMVNGTEQIQNSIYPLGNAASINLTVNNKGTKDTLVIPQIDSDNGVKYTPAAYTIATSLPISIAPGQSATITINRNTTGNPYDKYGRFIFHTNDPDKSLFAIQLWGIEGSVAKEPAYGPSLVLLSNATAYGFQIATQQLIPESVDSTPAKQLILIKDSYISEVPTDGATYSRGMNIGAAKVLVAGASGTFKPTYIMAGKTYYVKSFTYRGPDGYENYNISSIKLDSIVTPGLNPGTYYNGIDPNQTNFVTSLSAKINYHDTIFYSNYASVLVNNWLTRDTTNGKKVVNCVYTGIPYIYNDPFQWWNGTNGATLTREHTYPQSWMPSNTGNFPTGSNGKELPEYNDLHNLFPADQTNGNGVRSNYPFGEVVTVTSTSPSGLGKLGKNSAGQTVYEPRDDQKGKAARTLFYMATCYNGVNGQSWALNASQDTGLLMKWHRMYPVDAFEMARQEFIASQQHNRNPFIDHPEWANLINFKNMSYISPNGQTPSLTVTAPPSGSAWTENQSYAINWTSTVVDSVDIDYTTNGSSFTHITRIKASAGMYTWKVIAVGDSIRFRVKDAASALNANSNWIKIIKLAVPSVQFTSPVSVVSWNENDSHTISWTSSMIDSLDVDYAPNNSTFTHLVRVPAGIGAMLWKVIYLADTVVFRLKDPVSGTMALSSKVHIVKATGINENLKPTLHCYYNNDAQKIHIQLVNPTFDPVSAQINILDMSGKLVFTEKMQEHEMEIPFTRKGAFIVLIQSSKGVLKQKIWAE